MAEGHVKRVREQFNILLRKERQHLRQIKNIRVRREKVLKIVHHCHTCAQFDYFEPIDHGKYNCSKCSRRSSGRE